MEIKVKQTIEGTRARRLRCIRKRGGKGLLLQLISNRDRGLFLVLCEIAGRIIARTR